MTPPPTALDLDALEKLAEAATPGPWEKRPGIHSVHSVHGADTGLTNETLVADVFTDMQFSDAAFIAAARTAVPALVQRVRELEAAVTTLPPEHEEDTPRGNTCTCYACIYTEVVDAIRARVGLAKAGAK